MSPPRPVVEAPLTPWRIGEGAKLTGVTTRTLRYWEQIGLLSPSGHRGAGERLYSDAEVERVRRIKQLQELLGFSLAEVKVVLRPAHRLQLVERAIEANDRLLDRLNDTLARIEAFRDERVAKARRLRSAANDLRAGRGPRRKER